uniref:Uncharacterized protein n=1 Tax=Cacopsylla melanoneura TaxID=428564 RepID=A0A8D9A5I0_9HEMI
MPLQTELVGETLLTDVTLERFVPNVTVQMPLDFVQIVRTLIAQRTDVLGVFLDGSSLDNARNANLRVVQNATNGESDHLVAVDAVENCGRRRWRVATFLENDFEEI